MNALRQHLSPTLGRLSRGPGFAAAPSQYAFSTASRKPKTFKETWLMDPGTYPVIVVIVAACSLCVVASFRCLIQNPDVQIRKNNRQSKLRTWEGSSVFGQKD
uniref:Uncharacterized protein n=1 Tax=Corethron hystrix TaxID=216773 RepID=A0A7S1BRA2_9STRA|mmetsp:Transcript_36086/g.84291  ORF Transcript_36086/g.84291 Transcript_36086/m.84291 type:complete len:103 (+) Transcript_36086:60-368(+)